MKYLDIDLKKLMPLFRKVGLYSPANQFYAEKVRKHQQIIAYIPQIVSAFSKLSTKRQLVMLDCGCGKSYLSFVLYAYCRDVLGRSVKIIGVDRNPELIKQCNETAKALGYINMHFYAENLETFKLDGKIDIVYSLHACDTATDQTIAQGIALGAKYIFSASCCQHSNREKLSKHPLKKVTKHRPYKERLVDMIGDSMRALLLEHMGYGVKIFEFVGSEKTPKNIMLRAISNSAKKQDVTKAMSEYRRLVQMFNFAPKLEGLINFPQSGRYD